MKIAIIGYGRMGHEVEELARERGHDIVLTINQDNSHELTAENLSKADVAIEFSTPETAFNNVKVCLNAGIPVVSGTTGWLNQLEEAKNITNSKGGTLFFASNYSIGVNLFILINKLLSKHLNEVGGYDVAIEEIHHTRKKDAPSGTAISLATTIAKELTKFKGWTLLPELIEDNIPINAVREGDVPGTHSVTYDSSQDQIILTHRAKSRKGFAIGAVLAAEFSVGKKGFLTMDNFLGVD